MQKIQPTIKPGSKGQEVANLQEAIVVFLEKGSIKILNTLGRISIRELKLLKDVLFNEKEKTFFGEATTKLVIYFQVQHLLGDNLRGVVEETTAEKMNEELKKLGLLNDPIVERDPMRPFIIEATKLRTLPVLKKLRLVDDNDLSLLLESSNDHKTLLLSQWQEEKKVNMAETENLLNTINLYRIADSNTDVVTFLAKEGINQTKDLALMSKDSLAEMMRKEKINPPETKDVDSFAEELLAKAEAENPAAFFMSRIVEKPELLDIDTSMHPSISLQFKEFYKNNKDFDLINEPILSLETGKLNEKIKGIDQPTPELIKELSYAQQSLQLSSDTNMAALLFKNQINIRKAATSTHQALMRDLGIDADEAMEIKQKAQSHHEAVMNGYLSYRDIISNPFLKVSISTLNKVREEIFRGIGDKKNWDVIKQNNGLKDIDSIEDLFGSQNYCDCESCRSVLSPAAYFVDLMRFTEKRVLYRKSGNFNVKILESSNPIHLQVRRPDLWTMKLTCENTIKRIPYVEIVNDVLGTFIQKHLGTSLNLTQRLIQEQPDMEFSLPYNQYLDEVRIWLSYFKLNLIDLLEYLYPNPNNNEKLLIAIESLNLSKEQYNIIINQSLNAKVDKDVLSFRRKSGLSPEETEQIVKLMFWENKLSIAQIKDAGDIQKNHIEFSSTIQNWQGKLHRLIRLWKTTKWTLSELNLILQAYGINHGNLNETAILNLAAFRKIQNLLNLKVDVLVGILSGLESTNIDNATLAWNKILPTDWKQNDEALFSNLESGTDDDAFNLLMRLQGAFGVNSNDIISCIKLLMSNTTNPISPDGHKVIFNTAVLNQIFRYTQIFKWTEANSFETFTELLKIFGNGSAKYFNNPNDDIPLFVAFIESFQKNKISIEDLVYLFGNESVTSEVITTDKESLSSADIKELIKSDGFATGDKYKLFFNKWMSIDTDVLGYYKNFIETSDADFTALFTNLATASPANSTYIKLSNIKKRIERLEFLATKFKLNIEILKLIAIESQDCVYPKLGFTTWHSKEWVKELAYLSGWIEETVSLRNFNLWTTLKNIEKENTLPLATQKSIAKWKQIDVAQVVTLVPKTSSIKELKNIFTRIDWSKKLNLSSLLLDRIKATDNISELSIQSQTLKNAIRSLYKDNETWETETQDFRNKLSSNKRDALCNFVIFNQTLRAKDFGFDDREDLYRYFLLDVGMGDCFTLPKIVAATNSLQVYIHRCMMGFEQSKDEKVSVLLDLDEQEEWEWRKNYRVWEANRKIFLYPENYIEPEIRDNKSPEFKELEDELLQQKLNMEVVENAYKKYIQQIMTLAELKMAGAYYDADYNRIYLFGRTNRQPVEYYYRYVEFLEKGGAIWSNWLKMNIAIPTEDVSAVRYNGKLYVFWTTYQRKDISTTQSGNSNIVMHTYDVYVNYSFLQVDKKWSAPQKIELNYRTNSPYDAFLRINKYKTFVNDTSTPTFNSGAQEIRENVLKEFESVIYRKPYPIKTFDRNILRLDYIWTDQKDALLPRYRNTRAVIDAITKSVKLKVIVPIFEFEIESDVEFSFNRFDQIIHVATSPNDSEAPVAFNISSRTYPFYFGDDRLNFTLTFLDDGKKYELKTGNSAGNKIIFFKESDKIIASGNVDLIPKIEYIKVNKISHQKNYIKLADQKRINTTQTDIVPISSKEYNAYFDKFTDFYVTDGTSNYADGLNDFKIQQRDMVAILTTPAKPESNDGHKLNPEYIQMLWDKVSLSIDDLLEHQTQRHVSSQINYNKSFGNYFYELFFHIPMRIADHLNAAGKYREANHWYNYVYNPTAIKDQFEQLAFPHDVNWRFAAFRNIGIKTLQEIYGDPNAIEMYQRYPGNPHAIARLRIGAYQKNVVMKSLDNLMDWADYLYTQYTPESTSEARHLYNIVKTILGNKPESVGKCKETGELSYSEIDVNNNTDFIYNLFTVPPKYNEGHHKRPGRRIKKIMSDSSSRRIGNNTQPEKKHLKSTDKYFSYTEKSIEHERGMKEIFQHSKDLIKPDKVQVRPHRPIDLFDLESDLIFCFPVNKDFIAYWDRVNDRIYKLNNCLDINGVKKLMPAFAPEIDPALLARMVAGGMSFDEIVAALTSQLPNHRFIYLIEKAKQICNTVQSFGSALFAAIEKRENEELTLLRARHEQNILKLTSKNKKRQIEQAKTNYANILENEKNVKQRLTYYSNLIDEGLIEWETAEQVAKWTAGSIRTAEGVLQLLAGAFGLIPQLGSPFAMKYGGVELSGSANKFAHALEATAKIADNIAILAGLEGAHQRREQDWEFQVQTATQDLRTIAEQIRSNEISLAMAEYDLELHEKSIEQYQELYEFYTSKFSNYQHYTFHVQQLQKLYRMAYNLASDFAFKAQQAFEFERYGTQFTSNFIANDNWNTEKAGLLAGEQLMMQLLQLEKEYIETDKRKIEITQHFSMMQIAPNKLYDLKTTGECTDFVIPEAAFDLVYPGYFRRIIKSVRVSIPCITGPYTNIGATLTLGNNKIRKDKDSTLNDFNFTGCATIATSNAQNDGGQFELNFRDERYLPFEGAGAVSSWTLSLPKAHRAFDYNTISDVIFHISYTAAYDGVFKDTVESTLLTELNKIQGTGLLRAFSLRHDFPNEWNILNSSTNNVDVLISLKKEHFPYFTNIEEIASIEGYCFVTDSANKLTKKTDNEGIAKTSVKMQIKIPKGAGKKDYKDLVFVVKYVAK